MRPRLALACCAIFLGYTCDQTVASDDGGASQDEILSCEDVDGVDEFVSGFSINTTLLPEFYFHSSDSEYQSSRLGLSTVTKGRLYLPNGGVYINVDEAFFRYGKDRVITSPEYEDRDDDLIEDDQHNNRRRRALRECHCTTEIWYTSPDTIKDVDGKEYDVNHRHENLRQIHLIGVCPHACANSTKCNTILEQYPFIVTEKDCSRTRSCTLMSKMTILPYYCA